MPLQQTSGAASYDAFGGGVAVLPKFIEDYFSAYLYTGNNGTQTIANGLDLTGKGGLVWIKDRTQTWDNLLVDSARGNGNALFSNTTAASTAGYGVDLASNGFNLTSGDNISNKVRPYVSWSWAKAPKFFDVVTFTTDSSGAATVSHALGSTPAFVIVKRTDSTGLWFCWHTSLPSTNYYLFLNLTNAQTNSGGTWLTPTSTQVSFPSNTSTGALDSSASYVMYVYASNAGGFGLTGTDNVISCGSYTGTGSPVDVNLGYEAQWVLIKRTDSTGNWYLMDTMRGMSMTNALWLYPNTSGAEVDPTSAQCNPTATGFTISSTGSGLNAGGATYIYIAIRRGPMKVPTSGTSVFYPLARTGTGTATSISGVGFVPDFFLSQNRNVPGDPGPASSLSIVLSRLTNLKFLRTQTTSAEGDSTEVTSWNQSGVSLSADTYGRVNDTSVNTINYFMGRAPSFMDVVCYSGTGTTTTQTHNLQAVPELIIVKRRSGVAYWQVYSATYGRNYYAFLNDTQGFASDPGNAWGTTDPTSTTFSLSPLTETNASGSTYVAYLFATCAGVSKVGSYTGTATTKQVDCGFTGGARFVLIKKTSGTGSWYVWDSSRGIVSGNDPYLLLNSTAAEVTNTDYIDTYSAGFEISSTAPSEINASGGSFIFFAVA